ncbi:DnaJ domain-containing protein [Rufibacter tibetensis]|uniref:DnaJ domain-containing protein n=1 Tax=Rufibacter tibetensis TaxID=512763 RepID=UPI00078376DD|nr:DnaJ domain-containing protein [Rufibacter tibetensis]
MNKNYYQLLGIKETASQVEIKDAYRKLSKKVHPDLNQGEPFFEEYFKEVKEAYEILSDLEKKRQYDTRKFRPSIVSTPIMPSNVKNLEYQVSKLELKLRDQTEQYNILVAEKKSLHQELDHFVQALFEVKNDRNFLEKKVKELEKETANLRKGKTTIEKISTETTQQQLELHRKLHSLEQELQKTKQGLALASEEVARESHLKQSLEKRVQELMFEIGKQNLREKEQQALTQKATQQQTRIEELERQTDQIKVELQGKTKELALALQQRKTLQNQLHELENRQQQPAVAAAAVKGEKSKQQQNQILEVTTQKQALQNQVHDLELATEHLKQVLQDKSKSLQQEKNQKDELLTKIENLVKEAARQQEALDAKTNQLEQEANSKKALHEKIKHLEAETIRFQGLIKAKEEEHTKAAQQMLDLQGKMKALSQEEAKLQGTIQNLEQQAAKDKTELQASARALETSRNQHQVLLKQLEEQKKAAAASHLEMQKQVEEQKKAVVLAQQEMHKQVEGQKKATVVARQELQKKVKELEQEAAQKRTAQSRIQDLEKEKAAQHLKVSELQKELVAVRTRYAHLAHLQPFLVERMDFFNSAAPDAYGDSFDRAEIKYIFSRMKISVLADKPGTLNVLVKYVKPNGQLYLNPKTSPPGYSFAATLSYSPKDEYLYLSGWGSDRETTFVAGDHRVEIYDETGRQLTKADFQVREKIVTMSKLRNIFQKA